jgi:hypothetical protein
VDYTVAGGGDVTFFALGALLVELRTLVLAAQPLVPSDIALQSEGSKAKNVTATVDAGRILVPGTVVDVVRPRARHRSLCWQAREGVLRI